MIAQPTPALRFVRTLLTLWLAFILTQPVAVHACAMQNGTLRGAPEAVSGPVQHDMAAMTGGMMDAMNQDPSSPAGQTNKCHCFGDCAATTSVALLAAVYCAVPAPPHVLAETAATVPVERSFEQPVDLQPPATAPPIA